MVAEARELRLMICLLATIGLAAANPSTNLQGHQFFITSVRTGDAEIFLVDSTSGDAAKLTQNRGTEDRDPCWSPDGKRFTFRSDRHGTFNLYVAGVGCHKIRRITNLKPPTVDFHAEPGLRPERFWPSRGAALGWDLEGGGAKTFSRSSGS